MWGWLVGCWRTTGGKLSCCVHQLTTTITIKNLQPGRNNDARFQLLNQKNKFAAGFNTKCTFEDAILCSLEFDTKASSSLCAPLVKIWIFCFHKWSWLWLFITKPEKIQWEEDQKKTQKARKLISGDFVHFGCEWRKSADETPSEADYIKTWKILVLHVFMAVMEFVFLQSVQQLWELNQVWKQSSVLILGVIPQVYCLFSLIHECWLGIQIIFMFNVLCIFHSRATCTLF